MSWLALVSWLVIGANLVIVAINAWTLRRMRRSLAQTRARATEIEALAKAAGAYSEHLFACPLCRSGQQCWLGGELSFDFSEALARGREPGRVEKEA